VDVIDIAGLGPVRELRKIVVLIQGELVHHRMEEHACSAMDDEAKRAIVERNDKALGEMVQDVDQLGSIEVDVVSWLDDPCYEVPAGRI